MSSFPSITSSPMCNERVCSLTNRTEFTDPYQISSFRRKVYESLIMYYNNPIMYKIPSTNVDYSMYATGIACMCADRRYLIAICPADNNQIGIQLPLSRLNWVSFQARVSPTNYNVPSVYIESISNSFTESSIVQIKDENGIATYKSVDFPLKVQILGNGIYRNDGTIEEALQTFNTVLYFI